MLWDWFHKTYIGNLTNNTTPVHTKKGSLTYNQYPMLKVSQKHFKMATGKKTVLPKYRRSLISMLTNNGHQHATGKYFWVPWTIGDIIKH